MWVTPGSTPGVSPCLNWPLHPALAARAEVLVLWRCCCGPRAAAGCGAKPRLCQHLPREEPGAACARALELGLSRWLTKLCPSSDFPKRNKGQEWPSSLLPRLKKKQNWSGTWASSASAGNTLEASKWCGWYLEAVPCCGWGWFAKAVRCDGLKMHHHSVCGMWNGRREEKPPAPNVLNNELKVVID